MLVLLTGAMMGLGIFICVRALVPGPPSLDAALRRFESAGRSAPEPGPRLGRWLAGRIAGTPLDVRIPRKDLALLGRTPEEYLSQKILTGLFGLIGPVFLWSVLVPGAPWPLSGGITLVFAAIMFHGPDIAVRSQAREAREHARTALIAYLDLIKMARAGGAGPAEALETPVRVCHGKVFRQLATALDPVSRGTRDTWDELSRLADETGVRELSDVATIARRAGTQGARILDTLTAKAQSLRDQQLARMLAQAKSRTETMTVPVALSVFGYVLLLGYPAYSRITGGG